MKQSIYMCLMSTIDECERKETSEKEMAAGTNKTCHLLYGLVFVVHFVSMVHFHHGIRTMIKIISVSCI